MIPLGVQKRKGECIAHEISSFRKYQFDSLRLCIAITGLELGAQLDDNKPKATWIGIRGYYGFGVVLGLDVFSVLVL